jgi:hypothetical protein
MGGGHRNNREDAQEHLAADAVGTTKWQKFGSVSFRLETTELVSTNGSAQSKKNFKMLSAGKLSMALKCVWVL